MQTTSTTWRSLWAAGARLEARATIAGAVYTDISAPVITRALMQEGLSAGNAVSASCALSLRTPGTIPKAAAVLVEQRLNDGATASEWLPAGTFYISRRALDPVTGRLSLECYDALLKANALWTPSAGSWPRAMTAVAAELAALLGVAQDPRNALASALMLPEPAAGATVRDALGQIAAAHGGNWIITPEGKLRLVPLADDDRDAVTARGVLGRMDAGDPQAITGVRCSVDGETFISGDETGAVVALNGGTPAWAAEVAEALEGTTWQPFQLSGALYDPAAELGDALVAGADGEVDGVLCGETVTLGALFHSDARAPGPAEVADEYPYIGASAKALTVAKAYAETVSAEAAQALDNALTQLEIFNRLTGNGAAQGLYMVNGQLYVNASYIQTGTLSLGGVNNQNGTLRVLDASGNETSGLSNEGFFFKAPNYQNGLYISPGGSIAIGKKPDNMERLDDNTSIQLLRGGVAKMANIELASTTVGRCAYLVPVAYDGGGVWLDGKDDETHIASLTPAMSRFSSDVLRADGGLEVVGRVSFHTPLAVEQGGTGAITAPAALANLGAVGTSDIANNLTTTVAGKVLDARQGKALNDTKAAEIRFGTSVTTWSAVYNALSVLEVYKSAVFSSALEVASLLTGGNVTNLSMRGVVCKTSDTAFDFVAGSGTGSNLVAWRISGLTSASATPTIANFYIYGDYYETITDFDTFKPTGSTVSRRYGSCTGGTALHAPVSGNSETFRGYVEGVPTYFTQHFTTEYTNISYKNGREFVRVCLNGTFSPWQELRASLPLATVAANGGTLDIKIANYTMIKLTVTSYRTEDMGVALITVTNTAAAVKWLGTSPSNISLSGYSGSAITLTNNDANNNVYVLVEPIYGRAVSF